ncbi:major capsid pentamer protein [Gordonia phage Clawz]|uniref:Major capsid pentamer protein n=1 Tax=Gordonia phage Clawz TaxID=2743910 RepID=A0AAE7K790_9CAUD|nr:major capsid pentamer protein [Gordonia phage Clawz]QKY79957.1 major capsid pentamer protein [Gordonia phage Clawz]
MTAPTDLKIPPHIFEAPFANPIAGGLYAAATTEVVNDPPRLAFGLEVWPSNCGGVQRFDPKCGADNEDKAEQGDTAKASFGSIGVVAADECLFGRTDDEAQRRATQSLRLREQVEVEDWFAEVLLDKAGTPATAVGTGMEALVAAVGSIELALGQRGVPGVIHASAALAALAVHANVAKPSTNGRYTSPLGHTWAFGGGYGDLGNTIVGTGPVYVIQSSVVTGIGREVRQNTRLAIAEREIAVGYECAAVAANIA